METTPIEVLLSMYTENEIAFITGSCPIRRTNSPAGRVAMCYATTLHQLSDLDATFKCSHCKRINKKKSEIIVDCDANPKIIAGSGG